MRIRAGVTAAVIASATCLSTSAPAVAEVGVAAAAAPPAESTIDSFSDREVRRLLGKAADDVTFSVRDRRTGKTYTYNGDMRNSTASIVKVLVLATIVRERREDGRSLSSSQKRLADRMIRYSDNDATTSLFRQAGGRWAVQRMAKDLGMTRTTVRGAWGTTTTSAADQRLLVDRLTDGTPHLNRQDRAYILSLMARVIPEQRWGVGSVPAGQKVSVKNGWVPLSPRGWRVNSIGSVKGQGRDYTLAVLSYDNSSMGVGVTRTKKISSYVWRTLGPSGAAAVSASLAPGAKSRPFWLAEGAALPPHPFH